MKKKLTPFPDFYPYEKGRVREFNQLLKKYNQERNIPEKVFYVCLYREEIKTVSSRERYIKSRGPNSPLFYTHDGNRFQNVFRTRKEAVKELKKFLSMRVTEKENQISELKKKIEELK